MSKSLIIDNYLTGIRITVYEGRTYPVLAAPPERVLAFLMNQRDMTQTQLAEVLGIN